MNRKTQLQRALFSRASFVVSAALLLFALAGMARMLPVQAQMPDAPVAPAGIAAIDAAAFAPSSDPDRPPFVPGELLVGMQPAAAAAFNAASTGAATVAGFAVDGVIAASETVVTQIVEVPAGEELAAAQLIAQQPGVLYVEPNGYVWAAQEGLPIASMEEEADSLLTTPYHVNDAFYASNQWNMQRIGMSRAWQLALASGRFDAPSTDIVVAVVDSGVDPAHPEFAGRLLPGKNYVSLAQETLASCKDARFNVPMLDNYGHGTHVTGIIAASLNNGQGVAGVAPMVKIDPRRALGCQGNGTIGNVALAIREATDAGADIINLSLVVANYYATLAEAVEYAADAGVLIIAASGNAGVGSVYYPAALPEAIAVGALNYYDDAAAYSNYGPEVAIAAPGGDASGAVFSTWPSPSAFPMDGLGQPRTRCAAIRNNGTGYYCNSFGTSMAAPAVTGVAALMLALDPSLSPSAVRQILLNTATPLPGEFIDKVGAGKLNAYAAVRALLKPTLDLSPAGIFKQTMLLDDPYTLTVRIENPANTPLNWQANLDVNALIQAADPLPAVELGAANWISMTSGSNNSQTGSARWGNPGFITLRVQPSALAGGFNTSTLHLNATLPGNQVLNKRTDISVLLGQLVTRLSLPLIFAGGMPGGGTIPMMVTDVAPEAESASSDQVDDLTASAGWVNYTWAAPLNPASVMTLSIPGQNSVLVNLPEFVLVHGTTYTQLRVHENGFVMLPTTGTPSILSGANRCMPFTDAFGDVLFGWWADLDATASGAKVTAFPASGKRFVIQYEDVPALGAARPYKVTFQIVLDQAGNVRYNYKSVPAPDGKPANATIGAQSDSGLFYNEILCSTALQTFGEAPAPQQSYLIRSSDLY